MCVYRSLRFNLVIENLLISTALLKSAYESMVEFQSRNRESSYFNTKCILPKMRLTISFNLVIENLLISTSYVDDWLFLRNIVSIS